MTFKTERIKDYFNLCSEQSAKPFENLGKKYGFIFKRADVAKRNNEYQNENGLYCRQIEHYQAPPITSDQYENNVPSRIRGLIKKYAIDPYSPSSSTRTTKIHKIEIDHRCPVKTCLNQGIKVKNISKETIINEKLFLDHQLINTNINILKRSACEVCQNGYDIPKPSNIPRKAFKKNWEDTKNGIRNCEGCYWYNPLDPMRPDLFNADELKKQDKELQDRFYAGLKEEKEYKKWITSVQKKNSTSGFSQKF
jgi:hypothetical protein